MDYRRVYRVLKQHAIDNTAGLAATHPIFATLETAVLNLSHEVSQKSRITASGLSYCVTGFLFVRGRDLSRRVFGITPEHSELKKGLHDFLYTAAFNAVVGPIIYRAGGADWEKTMYGTLIAMGISPFSGFVGGYAIDAARDLTGVVPPKVALPERLPARIRALPACVKRGLYALGIAAGLGLLSMVYAVVPDHKPAVQTPAKLEQRVEQQYGNGQK